MRLLANENIASSLVRGHREAGRDVLSAKESMTGAKDQALLMRAVAEERILLTFDKDLANWHFVRACRHRAGSFSCA